VAGAPTSSISEQLHEGRDEEGADDGRVDQNCGCWAESELFGDDQLRGEEGAERDREQERRGGDDAPCAFEADSDGFAV
jgi:hypothetical protein